MQCDAVSLASQSQLSVPVLDYTHCAHVILLIVLCPILYIFF